MENASKALIIAGGILIAILIVSLLVYAWNIFSEYQSSRDSLSDIENAAKFNLQFTNYDRDDVLGYELLSLLNKVVDYNERTTNDNNKEYTASLDNNEDNPPVSLTINMNGKNEVLTFDNEVRLISRPQYTDNDLTVRHNKTRTSSFKSTVEDTIQNTLSILGVDESTLTSMAKNIKSIFKTETEIRNEAENTALSETDVMKRMIDKFNSYMAPHVLDYGDEYYKMLILEESGGKWKPRKTLETIDHVCTSDNLYVTLCQYYEYMQFKRGIFTCDALNYDQASGRVNEIVFTFTGNIK